MFVIIRGCSICIVYQTLHSGTQRHSRYHEVAYADLSRQWRGVSCHSTELVYLLYFFNIPLAVYVFPSIMSVNIALYRDEFKPCEFLQTGYVFVDTFYTLYVSPANRCPTIIQYILSWIVYFIMNILYCPCYLCFMHREVMLLPLVHMIKVGLEDKNIHHNTNRFQIFSVMLDRQ